MKSYIRGARRAASTDRRLRYAVVGLKSRGLTDSDVLLASYPRTGSTWLRFMLHNALTGKDAEFGQVLKVIPYLGRHGDAPAVLPGHGRVIKSHEVRSFGSARAVYLTRHPLDVALSEYRYTQRRGLFDGDLDEFIESFLKGRVNPYGSWKKHVEYWTRYPKLLSVVKYEDLRRDPEASLGLLLDSLGVSVDPEVTKRAVEENTLEKMQAKEDRSPFKNRPKRPDIKHVGSGSVEGWKESLSQEQANRITAAFGDAMRLVGYTP